jgi:hypothetical protein
MDGSGGSAVGCGDGFFVGVLVGGGVGM